MIQAYYKYKPASFEALALLVCADAKDRITQLYQAELLRLMLLHRRLPELPPKLTDILNNRPQKGRMTAEKASGFVDDMIAAFRKGGEK